MTDQCDHAMQPPVSDVQMVMCVCDHDGGEHEHVAWPGQQVTYPCAVEGCNCSNLRGIEEA
jgi:hypothetical protein